MCNTMNNKSNMSCLMSSFASICEKYGENSELMFAACWGVDYKKEENKILNKLQPKFSISFYYFAQKYLGIHIDIVNCEVDESILRMENALLNKQSVIVHLDAYYCPWNPAYSKAHIFHFCIIKSINYFNNTLTCEDPYISDQTYKWNMKLFYNAYKGLRIIKRIDLHDVINFNEICHLITGCYNENTDIKNVYQDCINDFLKVKDWQQLFECSEANNCKLILTTKQLSKYRLGIAEMLLEFYYRHLENKRIFSWYESFSMMSKHWNNITLILLKMLICQKVTEKLMKSIIDELEKLSIIEIYTYNNMRDYISVIG